MSHLALALPDVLQDAVHLVVLPPPPAPGDFLELLSRLGRGGCRCSAERVRAWQKGEDLRETKPLLVCKVTVEQ